MQDDKREKEENDAPKLKMWTDLSKNIKSVIGRESTFGKRSLVDDDNY